MKQIKEDYKEFWTSIIHVLSGHQKVAGEQYVSQPRQVSALNHKDFRVKLVTSSDAAVVVVTSRGDVYALHEYQCRKVVSK